MMDEYGIKSMKSVQAEKFI